MKIMSSPRSVDVDITNRCNLRCRYCFHFSSAGDVEQDLPKEEWLEFFEELNRCAVMSVCIQGGEPFCREDLPLLIEGIVKNRMRFNILSNGTLITDELALLLASTHRCDGVQVSIDGSNPITHDAVRGEGSFFRAIEGIERLRKRDISVSVRLTINRKNVNDLEGVARLLLEDLKLPSLGTNSASFMGLCRRNAQEVQLTVSERNLAMEALLEINKKYNGRISAMAGPLAEARNWLEMERARREGKRGLPKGGYLTSCGGVMSKMAVRADSVMVPCIMLSHMELGRINKDNLKEVWQNHPQLKRLRERRNVSLSDFEFCKGCNYIPYCTGNCPGLAYTIVGEENHPNPEACLRRFLEEGGRLPDERA